MDKPDPSHEFDKRLAVLEERMNSMHAKNESAIDRMNALIADLKTENANRDKEAVRREADLRADMANRDKEAANRDKEAANRETRLILAVALIVGIGLTLFGFLTTPPIP